MFFSPSEVTMTIDQIILFSIVATVFVGGNVQECSGYEFTADQFVGLWYDMGRISTCVHAHRSCNLYEITPHRLHGPMLVYRPVSIKNISICSHGVPLYISVSLVTLVNSTLLKSGIMDNPHKWSTVECYNNGTELIFSDLPGKRCGSPRYILWSRNRKVSQETKAEFEKLAENATVQYYAWDNCPKLSHETDDKFTLEQFEGLWYDIAKIYYGKLDISRCTTNNVRVDYENETFNITSIATEDGSQIEAKCIGRIIGSELHLRGVSADGNSITGIRAAPVISCNNGTELIFNLHRLPNYGLLSRNSEVSKGTIQKFKKLVKYLPNPKFTIYPQDDCPNRKN